MWHVWVRREMHRGFRWKKLKRLFGRPRRSWEDNIKMDLKEIRLDGFDLIHVAQDRDKWRVVVNTGMKFRIA
jgi:hypothetical protein